MCKRICGGVRGKAARQTWRFMPCLVSKGLAATALRWFRVHYLPGINGSLQSINLARDFRDEEERPAKEAKRRIYEQRQLGKHQATAVPPGCI